MPQKHFWSLCGSGRAYARAPAHWAPSVHVARLALCLVMDGSRFNRHRVCACELHKGCALPLHAHALQDTCAIGMGCSAPDLCHWCLLRWDAAMRSLRRTQKRRGVERGREELGRRRRKRSRKWPRRSPKTRRMKRSWWRRNEEALYPSNSRSKGCLAGACMTC